MTVINNKNISGITSINAQSNSLELFNSAGVSLLDLNTNSVTFPGNISGVGIGTDTPTLSVAGNVRVENSTDASQYLNISYQGIDFQNTGAGSSTTATSHLLDDYEEGTWTPGIEGATTAGIYTFTGTGTYTKVGNKVTVWGNLQNITTVSAGFGNTKVTGLPFVSATGLFNVVGSVALEHWSFSASERYAIARLQSGTNQMNPRIMRDSLDDAALGITSKTSNNADIFFCITYTVA